MRNLKIRSRLLGSFLAMALLVVITGVYGAVSMNRVGGEIQATLEQLSRQQKQALILARTQKSCQVSLMQAALAHSERGMLQQYLENYRAQRDLLHSQANILLEGDPQQNLKPAGKGSVVDTRTRQFLAGWAGVETVAGALLQGEGAADGRLQRLATHDLSAASEKAAADLDGIVADVETRLARASTDLANMRSSASLAFVTAIVGAILLALVLGLLITRNLLGRIKRLMAAANRGADGDLRGTVEVESHDELDELAKDFNGLIVRFSEMVRRVSRSSGELGGISATMSGASHTVVQAAQKQADSVARTSSAIAAINSSAKGVSRSVDSLALCATESASSMLEMASNVEEVVQNMENLSQSVAEVSSSIGEMGASIRQVGNGVVSLMEVSTATASSVMEMDSSIKQVEANANETAAISAAVRRDAETGQEAVQAVIKGMQEIKRSSLITGEVIRTLSDRAGDIGEILSVIDEVAEQTSLLALNAAIIAAQAGEQGKGFAVVADEIKDLSERTSSSTREIALVIRGVQEETRRAVEAIEQAQARIADGELLSQKSGQALSKIVVGVSEATAQVAEIARTTVEQAKGSQMIREAMEQVSEMVAQIAKATREQGQGSDLIMSAAENMRLLTSQVLSSTREQNKVGTLVATSTESITEMIREIKKSCDEQAHSSEQVISCVEEIRKTTGVNLEAAQAMNQAVTRLNRQADLLQKEMGAFNAVQ